MSKKLFKERQYNLGIVESYKKNTEQDSPILGSFNVKGMTVENMVSQNRTKYSPEVWSQPTAFGKSGKFLDENGKLRPSTLFGSVDHPIDNRAELLLQEAAIAWYDVDRNEDGSWDGSAHILNNPQGRIVKTFLDYAKQFGGGDLLGVSSRALGESVYSESNGEQVEAIVPDSFELMSFDFVYNPSFQTAVAHLNESKGSKKCVLAESVRALAEDDTDHAEVYTTCATQIENIEKEMTMENKEVVVEETIETKFEGNSVGNAKADYLKALQVQEKKLHDAMYDLKMMSDEEFSKTGQGDKNKVMKVLKKEYDEVVMEIDALENPVDNLEENKEVEKEVETKVEAETTEDKEVITEAELTDDEQADLEAAADEAADELEDDLDLELEIEEELEDEEAETEEEHDEFEEQTLAQLKAELDDLKAMIQDLKDFLMPVENPELELDDEELEEEEDLGEEDELDEETEDEADELDLDLELDEADLDNFTDEELEYLASIDL